MTLFEEFPFGDASVRLRAAVIASAVLGTVLELDVPHGNLASAMLIGTNGCSIMPNVPRKEGATRENDFMFVSQVMGELDAHDELETVVWHLGGDAPPDARGVLSQYFTLIRLLRDRVEDGEDVTAQLDAAQGDLDATIT